jgi:hypothetical protein
MARRIEAFREGDTIPNGAKFVRAEKREIPGSEYEEVGPPRSLFSWLGITEMVYLKVKTETVNIYEVETGDVG